MSKKENVCCNCNDVIDAFNENEYFGINYKIYCSLRCFGDENNAKEKRSNTKVKNSPQANKSNKGQKQVHKKKPKQKKRSRK